MKSKTIRTLVAAGCVVGAPGCVSGPRQRPLPPPAECPPGAAEAMRKLDIHYGWHGALFAPYDGPVSIVPVQEGPIMTRSIGPWGGLPDRTFFSGRVFVGTNRVFARFTEARMPSGEVVPVCLEMYENEDRGVPPMPGGTSERPLIISTVSVVPILRFE